jgi:hypothetical protein
MVQEKTVTADDQRLQAIQVAKALSFVLAAEEILHRGGLRNREQEFVEDMRSLAQYRARPGSRTSFEPSYRQMAWFRAIYVRVALAGKDPVKESTGNFPGPLVT